MICSKRLFWQHSTLTSEKKAEIVEFYNSLTPVQQDYIDELRLDSKEEAFYESDED